METRVIKILVPFVLLASVFFIVGFMTVVNGQCQGPLKLAFLTEAGSLKNTLATLISFSFFSGYLVNGPIAGRWINRFGYKVVLLRGLLLMAIGLGIYLLSSLSAGLPENFSLAVRKAVIPYGFFIFLVGSFLMGTSAALLQTVVIPYVSAYNLPDTQPVQRVNITCAANSLGTTIAPFFVTGVLFGGLSESELSAGQLKVPLIILIFCILLIWLIMRYMPLPDMPQTRVMHGDKAERSIWSFRHFRLGVVAIFFYVGAEVAVGTNINLHALEMKTIGLNGPALLATLYWGSMMLGRIISGFFNGISARSQLIIASVGSIVLLAITIATNNLWTLAAVGLFQSVMWGCIFTLAVEGLGKYTSQASGVFMGGVFGGAVFPIVQGILADLSSSWQRTWLLIIICEGVMLYYAVYGSRIKKGDLCCSETNNSGK
ncbi:MAG: MFS transporter [Odoribacter splanchnicus]